MAANPKLAKMVASIGIPGQFSHSINIGLVP
jgi:hypothetical protein